MFSASNPASHLEPRVAPDERTDAAIAALRSRNATAWEALFRNEVDALYRYVVSRLGPDAAEDATGSIFEEAWKSAESLRDQGLPARAWLFGIARNVVNRHRRRWFRRPPVLSLDAARDLGTSEPERAELLDLASAIHRLPADQAEVITRRFVHGLSAPEAAAVLAVSTDAVRGRQKRALATLRAGRTRPS